MSAAGAFVRDGNRLVLAFPDRLSREDWTRFGGELRKLGYGTDRPWKAMDRLSALCADCKTDGRAGFMLRPDQQAAAERLFFGKNPGPNDTETANRLDMAAYALFGGTDDPDMAGYVTPSGTMLNFSVEGRQRDIDHREVSELFEHEPDPPRDEPGGNRACMDRLISLGFIRLATYGINLGLPPTEPQYRALARACRSWDDQPIRLDFNAPDGNLAASASIPPMTPFRNIRNMIETYMDTGFLPEELAEDEGWRWASLTGKEGMT